MPPANPYSAGGMVKDPAMFFGRGEELGRIRDRLRKGDSTAVVGLRRIGKSSLLYQLAHQADALPESVVAVYLDLQDATHHQPLDLLTSTLRCLNERLDNRYEFPPVESLGVFSAAAKQIAADGFRPVLCLDEVEELTDRDTFDDDFFDALRSLGSQRQMAFVTASGESLDVLLKQGRRTSPFYNIFIDLDLAGLSDEAARALLTEPFRHTGMNPPSPDYISFALTLAGHYPFYLQMLAYYLFEVRAAGKRMNRDSLRKAFTRDAERHFRGLWNHLSETEREGVRRLAGLPGKITNEEIERLRRCGLVEGSLKKPRLFSDLFKQRVWEGVFDREAPARPPRSHVHTLKKVVNASVSRPWQRWVLGVLGAVSGVALALWLMFGLPGTPATLTCGGGDYVVTLEYPCYLATGDSGRVAWNLYNNTLQPITATLTIVLPPAHTQIEGSSNRYTLKDLAQSEVRPGQVSFRRRPPAHWFLWRTGTPITPTVELKVNDAPVACGGMVPPIQIGPVHGLKSFWVWLSTTGPLGWLALAGLEWFKAMGKKQANWLTPGTNE